MLPTVPVVYRLAVGNIKKKMDEINPLSKFLSPPRHFLYLRRRYLFRSGDHLRCNLRIISGLAIICDPIWGSLWVLGSFAGPYRARKSTSKVKIGQIVHHTVLFLKRSRHLGYPDYVICYGGSKPVWDANIGFQASVI